MFEVELGEKKYKVEKVTVRALAEMDEAHNAYKMIVDAMSGKSEHDEATYKDIIKKMVDWFVVFCGNQFTADEVYDNYPADKIVGDVVLAMEAVMAKVTDALTAFPTRARETTEAEGKEEKATRTKPSRSLFTRIFGKTAFLRKRRAKKTPF